MKNIILLFILLIWLLILRADTIDIQITFDTDKVILGKEMGYDTVDYPETIKMIELGKPQLCMKDVYVSIPFNSIINSVTLIDSQQQTIPGNFLMLPAQKPRKTHEYSTEIELILPDPLVYNTYQFYPQNPYSQPFISNFVGSTMGGIIVYPFRYNPVDRKLELYTSLTLRLNYTPPSPAPPAVRHMENRYKDMVIENVESLVQNPDDVEDNYEQINLFSLSDSPPSGYTLSAPDPNDRTSLPIDMLYPYTYVIITNDKYWSKSPTEETDGIPDECQPLLNWRTEIGVPATLRTVEWIQENYWDPDNEDIQKAIRDFLIDAHQYWGTQWVILIGDVNTKLQSITALEYKWSDGYAGIVPVKFLCAENYDPKSPFNLYFDPRYCPCDLYYFNLTDNFDGNNNGYYGEPDDIHNFPFSYRIDLWGGRVPADTETEVDNFLNKLFHYEKLDFSLPITETYLKRCIQASADDLNKDIYDLLNEGFFPNFNIQNIYEGYLSDTDNWQNYEARNPDYPEPWFVINAMSNPAGIVDFATHGGPLGFHILTHTDLWEKPGAYEQFLSSRHKYTNIYVHGWNFDKAFEDLNIAPKYSFLYTESCQTHMYDSGIEGVFAEEFLFNPTWGGPITVGNIRAGLIGYSIYLMKDFYDLMMKKTSDFSDDECYSGKIQYVVIKKYWPNTDGPYISLAYCNQLFGCPRTSIWRGDPNIFDISTEVIQNPDGSFTLRFSVINNNTQQPIENAFVCLWMRNELPSKYFVKQTDSNGIAEFNVGLGYNNASLTTTYDKFNYKPDIRNITIP